MRYLAIPLAALLLFAPACRRDVGPPAPHGRTIRPAVFARVLADLSVARASTLPDTQAWRARRAEVLRENGVTEEDLRTFAREYGEDDDVMAAAYDSMSARLDSLSRTLPPEEREHERDLFPSDSEGVAARRIPRPTPADTTDR